MGNDSSKKSNRQKSTDSSLKTTQPHIRQTTENSSQPIAGINTELRFKEHEKDVVISANVRPLSEQFSASPSDPNFVFSKRDRALSASFLGISATDVLAGPSDYLEQKFDDNEEYFKTSSPRQPSDLTENFLENFEKTQLYEVKKDLPWSFAAGRGLGEYKRALSQLLLVWPQYSSLSDLRPESLRWPCLKTLETVFTQLVEQQAELTTLQLQNQQLEEQVETIKRQLTDTTREQLHAISGKGVERNRAESNTSGTHQNRGRVSSDADIHKNEKSNSRRISSVMKPTPLIQAQADDPDLLRVNVLEDAQNSLTNNAELMLMKAKVERLSAVLEKERARGLLADDSHRQVSLLRDAGAGVNLKSELSVEDLVDRYSYLEHQALGSFFLMIDNAAPKITVDRKYRFIGELVEHSYIASTKMLAEFYEELNTLVNNPIRIGSDHSLDDYTNLFKSKFRSYKSLKRTAIPSTLIDQITCFLEKQSNSTDISILMAYVVEKLNGSYPDLVISKLAADPEFVEFIHSCCRLSWQMTLLVPPMHMTSEGMPRTFDDRFHKSLSFNAQSTSLISYYIWPTLFIRRHGDVCVKGRVIIEE